MRRILIAGAQPDTGNLGVTALCYSAVSRLKDIDSSLHFNIMDHGNGVRKECYDIDGKKCSLVGAKATKRFFNSSSFQNILFQLKLPFQVSEVAKNIKGARALLDVSGGDSFTDLYGENRFKAVVYPKKIAIENNIPLILLPQTYGPFSCEKKRNVAANLVKNASLAFARDSYSFNFLKELLGDDYNSDIHQEAVDLAFVLPKTEKASLIERKILPKQDCAKVFGLNISGLILNNPEVARDKYSIKIDYERTLTKIIQHILKNSDGEIWLIPHVLAPDGHYESDYSACREIASKLPPDLLPRVKIVSGKYDQCDIKGVISECDWFCGTRMHATIAALSSKVPTAAIAYSGKFKGVFKSAGQENAVFDARNLDTDSMIEKVIGAWDDREKVRLELEEKIHKVIETSFKQLENVVRCI